MTYTNWELPTISVVIISETEGGINGPSESDGGGRLGS